MRKLIMKMSITIDGFVAGPNGETDWIFKTGDEESKAWSLELVKKAGLIIMGRKSFETMATYWPTSTDAFAPTMNETPKAVFTQKGFKFTDPNPKQSLASASWASTQILDGDLAEEITKLKAQDGKPIVALGGASFMRSLITTGLVDEFNLAIHPVALGTGLPIFNGISMPQYLKLIDAKAFPGGVVVHTYGT